MTPFTHESRVLKEVNTITVYTDIEKIYIAALHESELLPSEKISDQISLKRFILKTRNLPKNIPFHEVAKIIRGKNKPNYTPHVDCGDNVIVINSCLK